MNILVTVGTGSFDSLIKYCDKIAFGSDLKFTFQTGKGIYRPKNGYYFDFDFYLNLGDFDLIISHCGAGTVYQCLNNKIPLIVIPNLERSDSHQSELATYLKNNKFCCVCTDFDELNDLIVKYNQSNYSTYNSVSFDFFGADYIVDIINDSFKVDK